MPTLLEAIETIMDRTSAATGVPRADMDNSLVFAAAEQEDYIRAQTKRITEVEEQNKSLEKDALEKITQLMKNQEILTSDCQKMASLLDMERTKVQYLGKLAELHRRKDATIDNEEWGVACAAAANLLGRVVIDETVSVETLKEAIKVVGTVLVGGIPESTDALKVERP